MPRHYFEPIHGTPAIIIEPTSVCDGDTFRGEWCPPLVLSSRFRLADVDASGRGRPGWTEATRRLSWWLRQGGLTLEWPYDRPGVCCNCNRPLIYLWRGETLINEDLIHHGLTRVLRTHTDTKHWERCAAAEDEAREMRRGIWWQARPEIQSG